jgi:hypothetical protein
MDFSPEELAAIDRDEAGIYRLTAEELAAIEDSGTWPEHPDPNVVVVHRVQRLADDFVYVRWYIQRQA